MLFGQPSPLRKIPRKIPTCHHSPSLANIDDESARQDSRQSKLHPPKPAEASEEDDDSPVAKRQKLSTPAPPKQAGDQNEQVEGSSKRSSERLKSLSDVPSEISFEAEIPILEKSTTTTSTAPHLRSSDEKPLSTAQETESSSGGVYANEKVDSLGIFFETTVHNSNVLHVCCQFDDSGGGGGGAKAGKAAGEEGWGVEGGGGGEFISCTSMLHVCTLR